MTSLIFYGFSFFLLISALAVVFCRNPVHSVLCLIFAFFNAAGLFVLQGAEFLAMLLVIVYVGAVAVLFLFVVMMLNISADDQRPLFVKSHFKRALETLSFFTTYGFTFTVIFLSLTLSPVVADLANQGKLIGGGFADVVHSIKHSPWLIFGDGKSSVYSFSISGISFLLARMGATQVTRQNFLTIMSGFVDSLAFMLLLGITFVLYFTFVGWNWIGSGIQGDLSDSPAPSTDLMSNTHALGQVIYGDYLFAFQGAGIILLIAMIGAITLTMRKREGVKRQNAFDQINRRVEETLVMKNPPVGKGVTL